MQEDDKSWDRVLFTAAEREMGKMEYKHHESLRQGRARDRCELTRRSNKIVGKDTSSCLKKLGNSITRKCSEI